MVFKHVKVIVFCSESVRFQLTWMTFASSQHLERYFFESVLLHVDFYEPVLLHGQLLLLVPSFHAVGNFITTKWIVQFDSVCHVH